MTFPVQKDTCSFVLGGWGGGLTGLSNLDGNNASENETTGYHDFEQNKWYKIKVRVTKTKMQVWIDDARVVDVVYTDKKIGIRSRSNSISHWGSAPTAARGRCGISR